MNGTSAVDIETDSGMRSIFAAAPVAGTPCMGAAGVEQDRTGLGTPLAAAAAIPAAAFHRCRNGGRRGPAGRRSRPERRGAGERHHGLGDVAPGVGFFEALPAQVVARDTEDGHGVVRISAAIPCSYQKSGMAVNATPGPVLIARPAPAGFIVVNKGVDDEGHNPGRLSVPAIKPDET
jgi:hypothetical protein